MASPKVELIPFQEQDDFDDDDFYNSPVKKDPAPQNSSSDTIELPEPTSATLSLTIPGLTIEPISLLEAPLASEHDSIEVEVGQMQILSDPAKPWTTRLEKNIWKKEQARLARLGNNKEKALPNAMDIEQKELPLDLESAQQNLNTSAIDAPIIKPELDPEFLQAAEGNKDNKDAEWRYDASDAESSESSESDSSDDSSEDESSSGSDLLLSIEEQARILMAGTEEEGPLSAAALRTHNEKEDEFQPKPELIITPEMKITELGDVQSVIDNYILVAAKTSGEYMVLEHGSVLCLQDRTVLGAVHETIGQVQSPIYMIGYNTVEEVKETGVAKGTKVFYVDEHSTYVFTETIRAHKGTDASNIFDEPIPEEEQAFSDDEQEQAFKRKKKSERKSQVERESQNGVLPRNNSQPQRPTGIAANSSQQKAYPSAMMYDDDEDDGMYKPLARPDNLHEMMATGAPVLGRGRGRGDRQWVDRGRGARGRGGRGRGNDAGATSQRPDNARRGRGGYRGQDQRSPLPARPEQSASPQSSAFSFVPPLVNGVPPPPPTAGMPFQFGQQGMPAFPIPPTGPEGVAQNNFQNGSAPAQLPPNFAQAFANFQQQFTQLSQQFNRPAPQPSQAPPPPLWPQTAVPPPMASHAWPGMQIQQQQPQQQMPQQAGPPNAQLEELLRMINANKPKE